MSENPRNKKKYYKNPKEKQKKIVYYQKKVDENNKNVKEPTEVQIDPSKKLSKNVILALYTPDFFNFLNVLNLAQEYSECFSVKKIPPTLLFKSNKSGAKGLLNPKRIHKERPKGRYNNEKREFYRDSHNEHNENQVPEWYDSSNKNIKEVTDEVNEWKSNLEKDEERISKAIQDSMKVQDFSKIDELMEEKLKNAEVCEEIENEEEIETEYIKQTLNEEEEEEEEAPEWGEVDVHELKDFKIPEEKLDIKPNFREEKDSQNLKIKESNLLNYDFEEKKLETSPKEENYNCNGIGSWANSISIPIKNKEASKNIQNHLGIKSINQPNSRKGSDNKPLKYNVLNSTTNTTMQKKVAPQNIEKLPQQSQIKKPQIPMEKLLSRIFPPMAKYNQFLIFSIFSSKFNYESDVESWYYKDPYEQVQGPFNSQNMDIWNTQGYFPSNLNVSWFQCQQFVTLEKFRNTPESIYKLGQIYSSKVIKINESVIEEYMQAEKRSSVDNPLNPNIEMSSNYFASSRKSEPSLLNIQLNVNQNVYNNQINTIQANPGSFENILNMASNMKNQNPFKNNEFSTNFNINEEKGDKSLGRNSGIKKFPIESDSNDLFSSLSKIKTFDETNPDITANDIKMILGIGNTNAMNKTSKPNSGNQSIPKNAKPVVFDSKNLADISKEEFPSLSDSNFGSKNSKKGCK